MTVTATAPTRKKQNRPKAPQPPPAAEQVQEQPRSEAERIRAEIAAAELRLTALREDYARVEQAEQQEAAERWLFDAKDAVKEAAMTTPGRALMVVLLQWLPGLTDQSRDELLRATVRPSTAGFVAFEEAFKAVDAPLTVIDDAGPERGAEVLVELAGLWKVKLPGKPLPLSSLASQAAGTSEPSSVSNAADGAAGSDQGHNGKAPDGNDCRAGASPRTVSRPRRPRGDGGTIPSPESKSNEPRESVPPRVRGTTGARKGKKAEASDDQVSGEAQSAPVGTDETVVLPPVSGILNGSLYTPEELGTTAKLVDHAHHAGLAKAIQQGSNYSVGEYTLALPDSEWPWIAVTPNPFDDLPLEDGELWLLPLVPVSRVMEEQDGSVFSGKTVKHGGRDVKAGNLALGYRVKIGGGK